MHHSKPTFNHTNWYKKAQLHICIHSSIFYVFFFFFFQKHSKYTKWHQKKVKHVVHCHDHFHAFDWYCVRNQRMGWQNKIQGGGKKLQVSWYKVDVKETWRILCLCGDIRDVGDLWFSMKNKKKRMVLIHVLSCTTCFFRYNKSKQQGEFPCLQGKYFFVHFVLQFFFFFLLSKWSKFPLNVQ